MTVSFQDHNVFVVSFLALGDRNTECSKAVFDCEPTESFYTRALGLKLSGLERKEIHRRWRSSTVCVTPRHLCVVANAQHSLGTRNSVVPKHCLGHFRAQLQRSLAPTQALGSLERSGERGCLLECREHGDHFRRMSPTLCSSPSSASIFALHGLVSSITPWAEIHSLHPTGKRVLVTDSTTLSASSIHFQTFANSGSEDHVIVRRYWEVNSGWPILGWADDIFSASTGEEDVVVDSAISIDNVIGEIAGAHVKRYTTRQWIGTGLVGSGLAKPICWNCCVWPRKRQRVSYNTCRLLLVLGMR